MQHIKGIMVKFFMPEFVSYLKMFNLNFTLNLGIPLLLVFQLVVYFKVDKLLTGLTAQQKETTA